MIWRILVILFSSSYRQLPNLLDSPLSIRLIEKISNIQSKGSERSKLQKSLSLDDLQERAVFSGINVDPQMKKASGDLLLQRGVDTLSLDDTSDSKKGNRIPESKSSSSVKGVRDTLSLEDPSSSKKGTSIPESKSNSSVKKMVSTFEGTTPQVFLFIQTF